MEFDVLDEEDELLLLYDVFVVRLLVQDFVLWGSSRMSVIP